MLKFVSSRVVPMGNRYFYTVPETGVHFEHPTRGMLMTNIRAHYTANALECPGNLEALVEDFICRHMPESFCCGDSSEPRKRAVTMADIRQATQALSVNGKVDKGVAIRRAAVCAKCPLNNRAACTSCTGVKAWARKLMGTTLDGLDDALGICEIDVSALSAKVHAVHKDDPADYPENCWRNQHEV